MQVLNEGALLANRYTLKRRLGAGGMSEVWLADDRQSGIRVALKFLAQQFAGDSAARERLRNEWRIGSNLMHAHIVRVFEFHDDPDRPFYSLQYLGETDLGVVSGAAPDVALRPIGLLADALRYTHAKGVVHCDIKASNVLLDERGAPCLVDFGIATVDGAAGGGGSAVNQSPQRRAGQAPQPADDIYALGVLLHELLTGRPPQGDEPLTLADGAPAPSAIRGLLADMLADDAGARPSAEDVAVRLRDAGFPPGPVPTRFVGPAATVADDEVVEAIRPVRRTSGPAELPAALRERDGVSPKVLAGGLAAALVLFLVVIYVLPAVFRPAPDQPAVAGQPAAESVAEPAASVDDDVDDENAVVTAPAASDTAFSENLGPESMSQGARVKAATDEALGDLLSRLERLRYRAIERWGGQPYLDAVDAYAEGDAAYLARNYALAGERYRTALDMLAPFFDQIDDVFDETLVAAEAAFAASDHSEAVRLYDLAVAITPGHRGAEAGLARARSLISVLDLTAQGEQFEKDLELDAAELAFERALDLDALWQPAAEGLERVRAAQKQFSFEMRMTEGLEALAIEDFASARAAFTAAKLLNPDSPQPADGLLQVDQGIRLANIRRLEAEVAALVADEQWEAAIPVYEEVLGIDPDLLFAREGLGLARTRSALHLRLKTLIDDPDSLSDAATMQSATRLLLDVTRISPMGARLDDQKSELSRLLKRAATPLRVQLVSDNATDVSIFKVGRFGTFTNRELELRPGVYVAVGNRIGYRDVRLEFRVAPEIEMKPIVVQCEERI